MNSPATTPGKAGSSGTGASRLASRMVFGQSGRRPAVCACSARQAWKHAGALLFLLAFAALPGAHAQNSDNSELRTVSGTIQDKSGKAIPSAVVYLKNERTLTVRTYISDAQGQYRFSGLDPNVDYQLHAEHANQTSANRTVSSLDSRDQIYISLKVNKPKKEAKKAPAQKQK